MNTIEFSPAKRYRDTNQTFINVSRNGQPFGQIFTFTGLGERHPWHAKPIRGEHRHFEGAYGLWRAIRYMREQAGVK